MRKPNVKRQKRPVDVLFTKTRQGILGVTFGQFTREWYLSELASHLNTSPSSLQRELESLSQSGILRRRQNGGRIYYRAETELPIFHELRGIVEKSLGVAEALRSALSRFDKLIDCAFIYGSVATESEHALSDVDVLIIGSVGLARLVTLLRKLEDKFRREINVTCYSREEFTRKARVGKHFPMSVIKGRKIFLKGGADELEEIIGG